MALETLYGLGALMAALLLAYLAIALIRAEDFQP